MRVQIPQDAKKKQNILHQYTMDDKKLELLYNIHDRLKSRCGIDYIHFQKPIKLELNSIGKTVYMEYLTPNWFDINDFINYQTDRIGTKQLSVEELQQIWNVI